MRLGQHSMRHNSFSLSRRSTSSYMNGLSRCSAANHSYDAELIWDTITQIECHKHGDNQTGISAWPAVQHVIEEDDGTSKRGRLDWTTRRTLAQQKEASVSHIVDISFGSVVSMSTKHQTWFVSISSVCRRRTLNYLKLRNRRRYQIGRINIGIQKI